MIDYDDYLARLERVLDRQRTAVTLPLPAQPQRHRLAPQEQQRYGLLDSYALKPCGVMALIGEHNAQLGKVAPPSQQLIYHHQLAYQLHKCDPSQLSDSGVALRQQVLTNKQQRLPSYSARLLLLSDEIWHNLDASAPANITHNPELLQAVIGLVTLKQVLADSQRTIAQPSAQLEQQLAVLHQQRQPRQMHRAMIESIQGLTQATELLQQADPNSCSPKQFDILFNILHRIYGKRIQPQLAQLQRLDRTITPSLQQLLSPWPDLPYFHFYLSEEPQSLRGQYQQAISAHTTAWQQLLQQCDASVNGKSFAMSRS
ncbi:DUF3080 family protein [uncultured Ferrimonas sp.]|uniref:DUF3080 family protein n=1 Tax=uncultured Ferrimonas sp. TaxID=432640 RepID=UPI00263384C1|nr:DUF3080 family protein [uncultured Ferrimonas sp.]